MAASCILCSHASRMTASATSGSRMARLSLVDWVFVLAFSEFCLAHQDARRTGPGAQHLDQAAHLSTTRLEQPCVNARSATFQELTRQQSKRSIPFWAPAPSFLSKGQRVPDAEMSAKWSSPIYNAA